MKNEKCDLIIIGGGLVGSALAIALAPCDLKIAIVDAKEVEAQDPRLYALSDTSCQLLKHLELWSQLEKTATPIHSIHVTRKGRFGSLTLDRKNVNLNALGHVIPGYLIERAVKEKLKTCKNIQCFYATKLEALSTDKTEVCVTLKNSTRSFTLTADWLIGADGSDSSVRELAHFKAEISDYKQSALVTRTSLQRPHNNVAHERFTEDGAIAMLPLSGLECATIWTGTKSHIEQLQEISQADFLQTLQIAFGYRLGKLQNSKERYVFSLRKIISDEVVKPPIYLLGNAAHTIHPIAAQGLNLALYEVALLAEKIMDNPTHSPLLSPQALESLGHLMKQQQKISIGLSHRLAGIFSSPSQLLGTGLQLGMLALDHTPVLKRKFITRVMGKEKHIPRLLTARVSSSA